MNAYDAPNPLEERMSQLHPDIEVPDSPTGRAPFVARAVDQSPESESPHLRQSVYDTPPRERTPSAPTRDEVSKDGSQGSHSIPSSPQEPPILPEHSNSEFQFSSPKAKTGQPPPVVRAAHRVSPPAPGVTPPSNIRGAPSERRSTHEDVFDPIETDSDSFLDRQQMHLSERLRINRTPKTLQPEPVTEKRSRETSNKPRSSTSSLTETSQASRLLLQGNAVGPPQAQPAPPSTCTSISDSHATSPPLVNNKQQHYSLNQNLIPAEALQDPPRVNIPAAIVNDSASSRALGKESGLTLLNKARANDVIDVGEHTLGVDAQKKPGKASSDHAFHTPADLERIEGKLPSANHLASKRLSREKVQREEELTRQGEQMMTAANGAKQLELERLIQVSAPRQLSLELNSAKKESTAKPGTTQYRPRTPAQKERRKELAANRRQKSKKEKADEGHGGTPTSSNSQPSLSSQHSKATKPVDASLSVIYSQTNAGLSSSPAPAGLTSKYPRSAMRASGTRSAVPRSVSFDASSTKYSGQGIGSEGRSDLDSTHSQVSSTSQSIENIDEVTVHNTQQRDSNDLAPLVHTQSNKITQSIQTQKRMIQSRLSVTKDRKLEGRSRDLSSSSPNLNSECVVVSSDSDRQDSVSCHSDGERNELSKSSRAESRTANKVTSPAQAPKTPVQHEHPKLATTLDPQLPQRGTRNATPRYSQAIASFGHSLSNISPHQSRSRSPADALSRSVSLNIDSRARRQESEVSDRSAVLDSESIESRSRTTHSNDDLASSSDESIQSPGPRALETGLIEPQQAQGSIPVREKTVISADPKDSSSHLHENLVSLERQQKKTNKSSIVASSLKSGLLSNSIPPKRKEESVSNSDLQNSSPQQHSKNSIAGSVKRDPKSNSAGSSKLKYSKISDMTRGVVADSPDPTVTNQNSRPKMQNVTPDAETSSSSSDEASSKPSGQGLCMAKRLQKCKCMCKD